MELGLAHRRVVVTGASRGIGRAIAQAFADEGCDLHLVGRTRESLEIAHSEIARTAHGTIDLQVADLADRSAPAAIAGACPAADIVVNNAGGMVRGTAVDTEEARWRSAWDTKVFGYVAMTREYLRLMQARRSGVIINIIGIGGEKVEYEYAAGAVGNAGLTAFTRAVGGASLDHNVRVLGVSPGWVETERTMSHLQAKAGEAYGDPQRWRDILAAWSLSRLVKPNEVADVVAFLASDRAGAVSGTVVNIDLGFAARSYPKLQPVPA